MWVLLRPVVVLLMVLLTAGFFVLTGNASYPECFICEAPEPANDLAFVPFLESDAASVAFRFEPAAARPVWSGVHEVVFSEDLFHQAAVWVDFEGAVCRGGGAAERYVLTVDHEVVDNEVGVEVTFKPLLGVDGVDDFSEAFGFTVDGAGALLSDACGKPSDCFPDGQRGVGCCAE